MARKKDPVGQMVAYFQSAPLATAQVVHKLIGGLLEGRTITEDAKSAEPAKAPQKPARRGRGPNKPKVAPVVGLTAN